MTEESKSPIQFPAYTVVSKDTNPLRVHLVSRSVGSAVDQCMPLFTSESALTSYLQRAELEQTCEGKKFPQGDDLTCFLRGAPPFVAWVAFDPIARDTETKLHRMRIAEVIRALDPRQTLDGSE